jgi:Tfp pilus assembly protein PilF
LKNFTSAIADYTKVIEMDPRNHEAFTNRGVAYQYMGENIRACLDWKKAAEMGSEKASQFHEKYCNQ